jgi:hypothetical protein
MTITIETVRTVRESRRNSEASWDACIETSETDTRSQAAAGAADSCDVEYCAAIESLLNGNAIDSLVHLEGARQLEAEWGDDAPAREATVAVARSVASLVVVETMPDHFRESHRAAGNWGVYPGNGACRTSVTPDEADKIIEADPDGYARVVV